MSLAMKCLEALGVSCDEIDYNNIISPAGRFNIVPYKESFIVIDFAHTPEALENICKEIKRSFQGYDLITIFGCGGDRDKTKRPLMGKVAIDESDFVIITSDNPRFEDPNLIINDITLGLNKSNYQVIVDRKEAIKVGFTKLDKTILLIAGKGHEAYIDQNGTKRAYSDLGEVNRNINND
jgi:UDP-N-acetylmuramoyl-L-alanyl-D-glutamate--2,6-diaminopimelate ligase